MNDSAGRSVNQAVQYYHTKCEACGWEISATLEEIVAATERHAHPDKVVIYLDDVLAIQLSAQTPPLPQIPLSVRLKDRAVDLLCKVLDYTFVTHPGIGHWTVAITGALLFLVVANFVLAAFGADFCVTTRGGDCSIWEGMWKWFR